MSRARPGSAHVIVAEVLQHAPQRGDRDRRETDELHAETVPGQRLRHRLGIEPAGLQPGLEPLRCAQAEQPDERERHQDQRRRLGEFEMIDEAQHDQQAEQAGGDEGQRQPRLAPDQQQPGDVDAGERDQLVGPGARVPAGAADHVEGHAQHPVRGGRPGDGKRDPVPQAGKRPHVDQLEDVLQHRVALSPGGPVRPPPVAQ
ncbi:hypothetical protein SDC9_19485 [bioreactor metagenome]|uniref:Uncharacterized protein n=1 Tax=bioreactor metagenome TaxID=1076179 RepID=A0A644U3K4_9ZZZZ